MEMLHENCKKRDFLNKFEDINAIMNGYLKDLSDITLMKSVAYGRKDALKELVSRYLSLVSLTSLRILCNQQDSEYVTRKVFDDLWRKVLEYDDRYTVRLWLVKITVKYSRRRFRFNKLRYFFGARQDLFSQMSPKADDVDDYQTTQAWEIYCRTCADLSVDQRISFSLREIEKLSEEETVKVTGFWKGKVRMGVDVGRTKVKIELKKFGKVSEYDAYVRFLRKVTLDGLISSMYYEIMKHIGH